MCKECVSKDRRAYYVKHKRKILDKQVKYIRKRRKSDPCFAMVDRLRRRLRHAVKGNLKADSTLNLLGCTKKEFIAHIEAQFVGGMCWEEREKFHIDHIKPCASFDLSDPAEQRKCFHYTNLQPLWGVDNLKKGMKYD